MKRKIVFVASTLQGFGLVKMMYYLVKYLDKDKFDIFIITLSPEPTNSMKSQFRELGISLTSLNLSRFKGMFYGSSKLGTYIESNAIDIVHSHGFRADLIVSKVGNKNFKWIITAHSDPDSEKPHFLGKYFERWRKKKHIAIIKANSRNVYAVSSTIQNRFKNIGINISTISNGIDVMVGDNVKDISRIKEEYAIPEDKNVCLVLSGLTRKKNVETIIKAFLDKRLNNHFLLVVGDGEEYKSIKLISESKSNIKLLGYVTNTTELFQISDFYITASLFEGLSLALLEAMYYGLIPVISNIPSHVEIVKGTVFENFTFDCFEQEQIVRNILEIDKHDKDLLSKSCHKIIESKYMADRMSRMYENIYLSDRL